MTHLTARSSRSVPCALLALFAVSIAACSARPTVPAIPPPVVAPAVATADEAIAQTRARFAPDRRVARFDVTAHDVDGTVVLRGETTTAEARAALAQSLTAQRIAFRDEILVLPDTALGAHAWALANNSVANLRTTPGHGAELSTQALLGTPLRLLRRQDGFYLAQTPDGYLSWVDGGGIHRITRDELRRYTAAPKRIFLETVGFAYAAPDIAAERVLDLVAGALLEPDGTAPDGWLRVRLPDGRPAYVREAQTARLDEWLAFTHASEAGLVAVARTLMGAPYLWGGTSAKGVDCSGFTRTVYLMNGLLLPRDASQQVHVGTLVDDRGDFAALRPGDLLFFGRPATDDSPERVVHVAMWIGDGRFIHSSGRVLINSMDPAAPDYDAHNHGRYLRSKRVLGSSKGIGVLRDGALFPF